MLKRNYDWIFLGKNLPSYLMGLQVLSKGQSSLILDDSRFAYGRLFENYLSEVQKESLTEWFRQNFHTDSLSIEDYLRPCTHHFSFGRNLIQVGETPLYNLFELYRKVPFIFMNDENNPVKENVRELLALGDDFNVQMHHLSKRIARFFSGPDYTIFPSFNDVIEEAPLAIKKLFLAFLDQYQKISQLASKGDNNAWDKLTFYFLSNSFYHKKISLPESEIELFLLMTALILPPWYLRAEAFKDALAQIYLQRGGDLRDSSVRDVSYENGKIWGLELKSYEGLVHGREIIEAGGPVQEYPFHAPIKDMCHFALVEIHGEDALNLGKYILSEEESPVGPHLFLYADLKHVGKDTPLIFIEMHHVPAPRIIVHIPIRRFLGVKEEFIQKDLAEILGSLVIWPFPSNLLVDMVNNGKFTLTQVSWPLGQMEKVFKALPKAPKGPLKYQSQGPLQYKLLMNTVKESLFLHKSDVHHAQFKEGILHGLSISETGELGQLSLLTHIASLL